jgi:hypothetical protein
MYYPIKACKVFPQSAYGQARFTVKGMGDWARIPEAQQISKAEPTMGSK